MQGRWSGCMIGSAIDIPPWLLSSLSPVFSQTVLDMIRLMIVEEEQNREIIIIRGQHKQHRIVMTWNRAILGGKSSKLERRSVG
jgi:hypothetical protein